MTKDNWIKAFRKSFGLQGATNVHIYQGYVDELESFISQVEKDAIEKTKEELKDYDTGRNWYFEGDELVITRGKWVIDRYKKHDRGEDL